jgi:hypothetical protein
VAIGTASILCSVCCPAEGFVVVRRVFPVDLSPPERGWGFEGITSFVTADGPGCLRDAAPADFANIQHTATTKLTRRAFVILLGYRPRTVTQHQTTLELTQGIANDCAGLYVMHYFERNNYIRNKMTLTAK